MILTCPECTTRYFADAQTIGPAGRSVRCASCQHTWRARPDAPEGPHEEPGEPDPLAELAAPDALASPPPPHKQVRAKAERRRREARARTAIAAWSGAGVAAASALVLAYAFRVEVVSAWPQAASAYALVGVEATARGLVFERITAERGFADGAPALLVSATVRNTTSRVRPVPRVRVALRDAGGIEVAHWTVAVAPAELAGEESTRFTAELVDPPADAQDLELRFVDAGGVAADLEPDAAPPSEEVAAVSDVHG